MVVARYMVEDILKTLPIGYYLGRNINVVLDDGANSFFDPIADKITIGYGMFKQTFAKVKTSYEMDLEEVIRGVLYHEISHVILTPKNLKMYNKRIADQINIFEDERIETLMHNYYLKVNFKKNIIFICDYHGYTKPKNAMDAFYQIVRFHAGPQQFIDRVKHIIKHFKNINAISTGGFVSDYVFEIEKLYNDIAKDFKRNPENYNQQPQNQNQNGNGQNDDNNSDQTQNNSNNPQNSNSSDCSDSSDSSSNDETEQTSDSGSSKSDDKSKDKDQSNDTNESDGNNDSNDRANDHANEDKNSKDKNDAKSNSSSKSAGHNLNDENDVSVDNPNELNDDKVDDLIKEFDEAFDENEVKSIVKSAINSILNVYYDPQITVKLQQIIDAKLKQKNKNGSAINSYSGRLNVRAVANRDDYKWWAQQNREGHINMYSKVHFNLIIDNSWSFHRNDRMMNKFLQSLSKIKNPDFDFDVITVNDNIVEWPKNTVQEFCSNAGTHLSSLIKYVIKDHTQPRANNYTIVCFDGDASPDRVGSNSNAFCYLDSPNTIIVTDRSNSRYVSEACSKSKIIITDNYCNEFINAILTLLERVM